MKILVITQHFWPEEFRINDICEGLVNDGYEVDVIAGIPNYPKGKFFDGYSLFKKRKEVYKDKINVIRVPTIPRGTGFVQLALNYFSYMFFGSIEVLKHLNKEYDRVFVFQVSPITLAIPGMLMSKLKKIKSIIYVQDLWPESFFTIKKSDNKILKALLNKLCRFVYTYFDTVLITSRGFKDILMEKGVKAERIVYFPQWAEDFYSKFDGEVEKSEQFVLTFAGNVGKAQSVDTIIRAADYAKQLRSNLDIKWQILGEGSEFENSKNLVEELHLDKAYFEFLGRKPAVTMPKYFAESDALIVTLTNEKLFNVTLPAKVQSYMAAAKPILSAISGEGKKIIEEAQCGLTCEAGDYKKLAENAIKLSEMTIKERVEMAKNAKSYFNNNFTRKKLLVQLENIFN
ncbi:MAG: glycosyltransferase family 4 protein [Sarcina sp.]